jgi:2-keto-4-pentenoate hydratase/2-oxohepta-3-ene-1,7-dioic acid hydratase in catechol pathway
MSTTTLNSDKEFTVSKIVCIGRNYARHISEMSAQRTKEPVLFLKPPSAILHPGNPILLPPFSSEIHHEIELALMVSRRASSIKREEWRSHIAAIGVALDLTLRDLQQQAKDNGLPWSVSKGFDGSCPVSEFIPLSDHIEPQDLMLKLDVNGVMKQYGSTSNMIFKIDELFSYISKIFTLEPGDLILTGTPEGVGPLKDGDRIHMQIDNLVGADFDVKSKLT